MFTTKLGQYLALMLIYGARQRPWAGGKGVARFPLRMDTIQPKVAVLSIGNGNEHRHPTRECVERLHLSRAAMFWTEAGSGVDPDSTLDHVWKNIAMQVEPGGKNFTVTGFGGTMAFENWPTAPVSAPTPLAWSVKRRLYHDNDCWLVKRIKPENLMRGAEPPPGKQPHKCVQ